MNDTMTRTGTEDRRLQPVDAFRSDGTDVWHEDDDRTRVRGFFPLTPGMPHASDVAGSDLTIVCMEIDPDHYLPIHRDDTEELFLVTAGAIEATIGEETIELGTEECAVIPENVPHRVRNDGDEVARAVSFFPSTELSATFEKPLMPFGEAEITIRPDADAQ